jgi:hypothetical protein
MNNGFGAEGVMAKVIAALLDVFGLLCFGLSMGGDADLGLGISFIPDFLGIGFLGGSRLTKKEMAVVFFLGLGLLYLKFFGNGNVNLGLEALLIPKLLSATLIGGLRVLKRKGGEKKKNKSFLWTVLGEICPFLGDIFPFWSIDAWKRKK